MQSTQWIELIVEANGTAVTIDDVVIDRGVLDDTSNGPFAHTKKNAKQFMMRIFDGKSGGFRASGQRGEGSKGSASLLADGEIVGILNWDCTDLLGRNKLDWTPLSNAYKTSLTGGSKSGAALGKVVIRCQKKPSRNPFNNKIIPDFGRFGIAGA